MAERPDFEEEDMEQDFEDVEELDDEEIVEADQGELGAAPAEEESDEASLEELLAQRGGARRQEEAEEEEDIMSLASERDATPAESLRVKVDPIKDRQEFVCRRCHLVKAKSQLTDVNRVLCRDCA